MVCTYRTSTGRESLATGKRKGQTDCSLAVNILRVTIAVVRVVDGACTPALSGGGWPSGTFGSLGLVFGSCGIVFGPCGILAVLTTDAMGQLGDVPEVVFGVSHLVGLDVGIQGLASDGVQRSHSYTTLERRICPRPGDIQILGIHVLAVFVTKPGTQQSIQASGHGSKNIAIGYEKLTHMGVRLFHHMVAQFGDCMHK